MLVPHRLIPYPSKVLYQSHRRVDFTYYEPMDWVDMNCCLPLQNCDERKTWVSIKNTSVYVINVFGLSVALGNINFHEEKFRACVLEKYGSSDSVCQ